LTLFDLHAAQTHISLGWSPELKLQLLESPEVVLTEDFDKRDRRATLLAREPLLAQAWKLMTTACEQQYRKRLGEVATLRAIASQDLLTTPCCSELHALSH
ncbi:GHMP kinase, partial [Morganella morganii]|nr:GHMP kinase [Morganella morganii]